MWQYRLGVAGSLFTLRGLDRKVLRTYDSSLGVNAFSDAIWANGRLFTTITSAGVVTHWHTDELGTPIAQTNPSGGLQFFYAYFPYGEEIDQSVVDPARFRFTGHERDFGTQPGTADDRDYMHQRATLPQLGRFLSVDPIGGNPFNPQSWNRFTYALNNPMKYIDPLGLLADVITVTGTLGPEIGPAYPVVHNPPTTAEGDGSGGDSDGDSIEVTGLDEATLPVCGGAPEGLQHYLDGSGDPMSYPLSELGTERMNLNSFPGFAKSANAACRGGSCSYIQSAVFDTGSRLIGNHNFNLEGEFTAADGRWSFSGSLYGGIDRYNMNQANRPFIKETLTTMGRTAGSLLGSKPFDIYITGIREVHAEGRCP